MSLIALGFVVLSAIGIRIVSADPLNERGEDRPHLVAIHVHGGLDGFELRAGPFSR
jgi:hypothetical protein